MKNLDEINKINNVIESYFNSNPTINSIQAKTIMPLLIEAGVFSKDHKAGLPIRDLLRELDDINALHLIPYVRPERKKKNTYWYFERSNK